MDLTTKKEIKNEKMIIKKYYCMGIPYYKIKKYHDGLRKKYLFGIKISQRNASGAFNNIENSCIYNNNGTLKDIASKLEELEMLIESLTEYLRQAKRFQNRLIEKFPDLNEK